MVLKQKSRTKSFWTPFRVGLTGVVLVLVSLLGTSSCNSTDESARNSAPAVKPNPQPASRPPELMSLPEKVMTAELKSVDGGPIKLSDYSGKVLVVNLWATWCGPCRMETPELVKLHKEYGPKGVEMVGLSTENPDASAESVKDFVRTFSVDYRIGWATPEVAITLMQGRDAIPQSFVIARNGQVVRRFVGFNISATPPQLKQAIEAALKG